MADKQYQPAKPNPQPPFPSSKNQPFNRPIYQYRPQPQSSKSPCFRGCCISAILALLSLIVLAAIAGGIFYAIYRPHRPTFSISSLRLSSLNTTSSNHFTSRLDLSVTARNPNPRIDYNYDQISISISSNGVGIGEGSFPGFVHSAKNTTVLSSLASTRSDLKKGTVPLEFYMETKVRMKVGRLKTSKFRMKVYCDGIEIAAPKGKKAGTASNLDSSCKVKLRMKFWKWMI
ncbi:NDR1/HIN1-like protein 2 [Phalaenopsis equestris]|uniref:NDR1/HIN1-like protein 2 n=1 Tax=Phalaenopsis equestris TaxID=78828 RepID=UPI0009E4AC83|nr:NDR1/HIN1-like protein 2 [Phalaenopsis equestris]